MALSAPRFELTRSVGPPIMSEVIGCSPSSRCGDSLRRLLFEMLTPA
jgi:hypothetical protein